MDNEAISTIEDMLVELEFMKNFLTLAAEEANGAGTDYDFNNQMNVLRACSYAERSAIMLSLIYTTADKADLIHNTLESIVEGAIKQ